MPIEPIEPIQPETDEVVDEVEEAGEAEVERQTKGFVMNHSVSRSTR
jgi:hypothetical protein